MPRSRYLEGQLLSAMVILLFLLPAVSSFHDDIKHSPIDTLSFELEIRSKPTIDRTGHLWLQDVSLNIDDRINYGFSSGEPFQIVYDPSPGAPMLPWISTVVRIKGDITGYTINTLETGDPMEDLHLTTMRRATDPWDPGDIEGVWSPGQDLFDEGLQFASAGYQRVEGELYQVYTIYYLPFTHGPGGSPCHVHDASIEMEMNGEASGPAPSRLQGDASQVPGSLSITEFLDIRPEYLIVTTRDLVDELSELARWRNEMGIATSIVTMEDILEVYSGSDDPADLLRQYIKDVLDGWGMLRFVLLAGDWETVPVKSVYDSHAHEGWDDGTIPADSYYQCLDGSWDLDGDGQFGEPQDIEDSVPDVIVSRLAIDDPYTWERKIEQIMDHELGEYENAWSGKAVLIGANTHNEGDGRTHSEYLWDKYLDRAFSEKMPMYEDEGGLTRSSVDDALEGGVSFVQFVDHGGPTVWCDDYGAGVIYNDRDASSLTNGEMLPFVSTLACLTTWFDDTSGCPSQRFSESLGEAFTENTDGGALAYVGSSRTSVGILGVERYLPYDNGLQEDIARQIGGLSVYSAGSIHTGAKTHYAESWSREFSNPNNAEVSLCWLEFTLLGEPLSQIWTSDAKQLYLDVEHEDDLDPYILIRVLDEHGDPVPDVNVTLQNFNRGVFERGTSDIEGEVEFDLELDWFCDINLTASKHDHMLYKDFIRISDVIPPETVIVTDPVVPDGDDRWFLEEPEVRLVPNEKAVVHYSTSGAIYSTLNCTGNFTLPALGEGEHSIHFFGEDIAGNLEMEKHEIIRIDLHDPNITCGIVPGSPNGENGWYSSEPHITFLSSQEDHGSPLSIMYRSNKNGWIAYEEPFFLGEGLHELGYMAVDGSGRSSRILNMTIKVDTTPPATTISIEDAGGKDGWYTETPSVELSSSEPSARLEYRLDPRGQFLEYSYPFSVPDGIYDMQYRSMDMSGNIGPTETMPIKVDTGDPVVQCLMDPPSPDGLDGYYVTTPTVNIFCFDNMEAVIFTRVDKGDWIMGLDRYDMEDGEHMLEIYAEDTAGNECPVIEMTFKVDTVEPLTVMDIMGTRNGIWFTSMPLIHLRSDEDAVIYYEWEGETSTRRYDGPMDTPGREGMFTLTFHSRDNAGNVGSDVHQIIRVDTSDPVLRVETLNSGKEQVLIDCSDSTDGTDMEFRILEDGSVLVDWTSNSLISLEPGNGEHTLTVEVRDMAGNWKSVEVDVYLEPAFLTVLKVAFPISIVLIAIILALTIFVKAKRRSRPGISPEPYNNMNDGYRYNAYLVEEIDD